MASKVIGISLAMVLVAALCSGAAAQMGCTSALMSLSSCLNYVTGNTSSPSSSCCSGLGSVVQLQPQCLCSLLNGGGSSLGITINQTLALALPGACNVQTPPLSQCNAANGPTPSSVASPASSPVGSPAESSDDTPETEIPSTPSQTNLPSGGAVSKNVPSTKGSTSNGSIIKGSSHLVLFVLFVASFASAATAGF